MWRFRLIPDKTAIPFLRLRRTFFIVSITLAVLSVAVLLGRGLNFGIDFAGGILIEVGTEREADIGQMRSALTGLGLGEIALQEFGSPTEVLIRIERQPGDAGAQQVAVTAVREALSANYSDTLSYRRVETVGPKVGSELIQAGIIAVVVSVFLMLVYIWFRFELPFAIGAVIALIHDVLLSLGIFAALGLEFNLPIVAAILLIVGYSMNDTVVVYDRVRENLRKYKTMPLLELLNQSVNETPGAHRHHLDDDLAGLARAPHLRRRRHPRLQLRDDLGRDRRHLFVGLHRGRASALCAAPAGRPEEDRGPGGAGGRRRRGGVAHRSCGRACARAARVRCAGSRRGRIGGGGGSGRGGAHGGRRGRAGDLRVAQAAPREFRARPPPPRKRGKR